MGHSLAKGLYEFAGSQGKPLRSNQSKFPGERSEQTPWVLTRGPQSLKTGAPSTLRKSFSTCIESQGAVRKERYEGGS